uniref:Hint domain-containing protein n=1 Tax=Parascaris univalens TaxID=6257 RepID=A0A915CIV1_PARUN
ISNGEIKRMDELKVNDWILSARNADMEYVRVKSWMHRLPQQEATFLQLNLDDGNSIKLTRKHFIYRTDCSGSGEFVQHIKNDAIWAE